MSVDGTLQFDALQQRIHPAASRVAMLAQKMPARYLIFDLLREGANDLLEQPLERRRPKLERFLQAHAKSSDELLLSPATQSYDEAQGWLEDTRGALDGVIAKKLGVPYASAGAMLRSKSSVNAPRTASSADFAMRRIRRRTSVRCYWASSTMKDCSTTSDSAARSRPRKRANCSSASSRTSVRPGSPEALRTPRRAVGIAAAPRPVRSAAPRSRPRGRVRSGNRRPHPPRNAPGPLAHRQSPAAMHPRPVKLSNI